MKFRSYLETAALNLSLIGDAELTHFYLEVRDEVERRTVSDENFNKAYFAAAWDRNRKKMEKER